MRETHAYNYDACRHQLHGARPVATRAVVEPDAPVDTRRVFTFGNGTADGDASMKTLLGGKGANLAEMSNIGLSVPAGFTVTTEVCAQFHENGGERQTATYGV